jgi:peroxiredoxin
MNRLVPLAVLAVVTALNASPPKVGQPAPGFTLLDQGGNAVSLSAARGAKVVLVFYRGYW